MRKKGWDAVATVRRIRDKHYEELKDATFEQRLEFYREKARQLHEELGLPPIGSDVTPNQGQ